jgi:hypothetical protein
MDRVDSPVEIRAYGLESRGNEAEHYVAIARGFKDVDEFRAFRAAREIRGNSDARDYERRLAVILLSQEVK